MPTDRHGYVEDKQNKEIRTQDTASVPFVESVERSSVKSVAGVAFAFVV